MSHRSDMIKNSMPDTVEQAPEISSFTEAGVVFSDGRNCDCGIVVMCTGYEYKFPFILDDNIVQVQNGRVTPLYKHLISINYHNLPFMGLAQMVTPFPMYSPQAAFAYGVMSSTVTPLPLVDKMLADEYADYQHHKVKGMADKYCHNMFETQFRYNKELKDVGSRLWRLRLSLKVCSCIRQNKGSRE